MLDLANIQQLVASSYADLKTVAADLNAVSDDLGKSISQIDAVLKNLNLGITVWVTMDSGHGDPDQGDVSYWSEDIGYTKYLGRWGICLRQVEGDPSADRESVEQWHFNDAPRGLRLSAVDRLVELLKKLGEEGRKTTEEIKRRLSEARSVAGALSQAAWTPAPPRPKNQTQEAK